MHLALVCVGATDSSLFLILHPFPYTYLMLPRSYRIPTSQFPEVTRGKSHMGERLRVVVKPDTNLTHARCAVIVSNKTAKSAAARNRVRRQVYDALGMLAPQLPRAWISVFPKRVPLDHADILAELRSLFSQ